MTCTALLARQDYQPDAACAADAPGPVDPPNPHNCSGTPGLPQARRCDINGERCGIQTRERECNHNTGQWVWGAWSDCTPHDCNDPNRDDCGPRPTDDLQMSSCTIEDCFGSANQGTEPCGYKSRGYECNTTTHQWQLGGWDTSRCVRYKPTVPVTKACTEIDPTRYMSGTANCLQDQTCQQHTVIPSGEPHDCDPSGCQCYTLRWVMNCTSSSCFMEHGACRNTTPAPDGQPCASEGEERYGVACAGDISDPNAGVEHWVVVCQKVQVACQ